MEELETIDGKFTHIIFHNDSNYYTVARFVINGESEKRLTVTGILPEIELDIQYRLSGSYTEHPRYGVQFAASMYERMLPNEKEGIVRYLSSAQFAGVGRKTAELIADTLGNEALGMIKEDPEVLRTIPGLNEKQILSIQEGIKQEEDGMEQLVRFLNVHGIGMRNLIRLNQAYGKEALQKIQENPYRVIEECDGFGFETADKIAASLGFSQDDPRRLYAYLISLTMDLCMRSGSSYCTYEDLKNTFASRFRGVSFDFDDLLQEGVIHRTIIFEEGRVYPVSQYDAETYIADYLNNFPYRTLEEYDPELLDQYLESMEKDIGITYDEKQVSAIHSFFDHPLSIMTGGPGTGKTTVIRALVTLFHMIYPSSLIVCSAPTGRAAKRLAELTNMESTTIHSLLQWNLETNQFNKDEDDPIAADLLIIDEFSMVDAYLFSNLLKAAKNVKKICIIGDEDQLPSVGPGSVLRDLIQTELFPVSKLEHIYRQRNGSDVINLAHHISTDQVVPDDFKGDVAFFSCTAPQIKQTIVSIVQSALAQGFTLDDIQVLSPMYNGSAGIDVLNNTLQEQFNGPDIMKKEVRAGYMTFREGDKILQLKNQPDDDIYNGDIGILEEIIDAKETEDKKTTIVVNFDHNYVEYKPENWQNITLAYCISVHKSQGSEYPIIIMPFSSQHTIMLQKKLIYTGITRAKKALVLLGDKGDFDRGIHTVDRSPRYTTLKNRIAAASNSDMNLG